jgi:hypothetical protein
VRLFGVLPRDGSPPIAKSAPGKQPQKDRLASVAWPNSARFARSAFD